MISVLVKLLSYHSGKPNFHNPKPPVSLNPTTLPIPTKQVNNHPRAVKMHRGKQQATTEEIVMNQWGAGVGKQNKMKPTWWKGRRSRSRDHQSFKRSINLQNRCCYRIVQTRPRRHRAWKSAVLLYPPKRFQMTKNPRGTSEMVCREKKEYPAAPKAANGRVMQWSPGERRLTHM